MDEENDIIKEGIKELNIASKKRAGYRKILLRYIRENIDSYPDEHTKKLLIQKIKKIQLSNISDSDITIHAKLILDTKEGEKPDE